MSVLAGSDDYRAFVYPVLPFHEVPPMLQSSGEDQTSLEVLSGLGTWTSGALYGTPDDLSISLGGYGVKDALTAACASRFDFFVYDLAAVTPPKAIEDAAYLRQQGGVVGPYDDDEGHFAAWKLNGCNGENWPPLSSFPRISYRGDGTYGEFSQSIDELGTFRLASATIDLRVSTNPSAARFSLQLTVVSVSDSLRVVLADQTYDQPITPGVATNISIPLCGVSPTEMMSISFGNSAQDVNLKIRGLRVVPSPAASGDAACSSVSVRES